MQDDNDTTQRPPERGPRVVRVPMQRDAQSAAEAFMQLAQLMMEDDEDNNDTPHRTLLERPSQRPAEIPGDIPLHIHAALSLHTVAEFLAKNHLNRT